MGTGTLIVAGIFGFIGIIFAILRGSHIRPAAWGVGMGAVALLVQLLLFPVIFDRVTVETGSEEVIALQDAQTEAGQAFLGSGVIEGSMSYFYMVRGEHGLKTEVMPIEDVYVIEEDRSFAEMKRYKEVYASDFLEKWFGTGTTSHVVFHVPTGTILFEKEVDLK